MIKDWLRTFLPDGLERGRLPEGKEFCARAAARPRIPVCHALHVTEVEHPTRASMLFERFIWTRSSCCARSLLKTGSRKSADPARRGCTSTPAPEVQVAVHRFGGPGSCIVPPRGPGRLFRRRRARRPFGPRGARLPAPRGLAPFRWRAPAKRSPKEGRRVP